MQSRHTDPQPVLFRGYHAHMNLIEEGKDGKTFQDYMSGCADAAGNCLTGGCNPADHRSRG